MIKKGLKVRVLTGKDKKKEGEVIEIDRDNNRAKVKVLSGRDKNKEGEVIEIDRSNNRAKIKDINMVKKHVKTTKEKKGGIFSKESFIHISNLRLIDEKIKNKKKEAKK